MKMVSLISTLLVCWNFHIAAQGVHLSAGDTVTIGFNGFDSCHPTDGGEGSAVFVVFGNDSFGLGDTVRLEMFADTLNDPAFTTQNFSPAVPTSYVVATGSGAGWLDNQGLVRVSMLSGSADVLGAHFVVSRVSTECDAIVAVPEPHTMILLALGCSITMVRFARRARKQGAPAFQRS